MSGVNTTSNIDIGISKMLKTVSTIKDSNQQLLDDIGEVIELGINSNLDYRASMNDSKLGRVHIGNTILYGSKVEYVDSDIVDEKLIATKQSNTLNSENIIISDKDKKGIENSITDWVTDCFHRYK